MVVTLLGTRVFPRPNIYDVIMDLRAETQPFLTGEAHAGMVIGSRNILARCWETLREAVLANPGYSLLVVGYSLGAGLAQLLSLDCLLGGCSTSLPPNTNIKTVAFGSPPVFSSLGGDGEAPPVLDNVFIVQNGEDGIGGYRGFIE